MSNFTPYFFTTNSCLSRPLPDVLFTSRRGHKVGEFVGGADEDMDAEVGEEFGIAVVVAGGAIVVGICGKPGGQPSEAKVGNEEK